MSGRHPACRSIGYIPAFMILAGACAASGEEARLNFRVTHFDHLSLCRPTAAPPRVERAVSRSAGPFASRTTAMRSRRTSLTEGRTSS